MSKVLIVDDDKNILTTLAVYLEDLGWEVLTAETGGQALELVGRHHPSVVLLDLKLPDQSGLEVLEKIKATWAKSYVVIITAYATIDTAVSAVKLGAFDYLPKPFTPAQVEHLLSMIQKVDSLESEVESLKDRLKGIERQGDFVTRSKKVRALLKMARQAADSDASILLAGESGTGKGVLAGLIHGWSPRAQGPLVQVDCTVLQESLLESDLFGHRRGAFTGAVENKIGKLAQADGGTVFLDEVTEMSGAVQAKLLHFLQSREFTPVGDTTPQQVDARIIAATNRNLEQAVSEGVFREDLFYRLNVVEITLPPLRERPGDIELLAELYRKRFSREKGGAPKGFSKDALTTLLAYPWPGNVREMINAVQRGCIVSQGELITPQDLPPNITGSRGSEGGDGVLRSLEAVEREHIQKVLAHTHTIEEAAQVLAIDPATLWRKRKKYRLD
ncbi:MAG: sigma-54-dependent Fis family transcriptional regulator [Desulfarculus sp.]|jgi:NtrC-family two-component system response regulator AlgB|nr:MAG: sigma-54-dependent Fis family transcriptional regulator [Desulfarculus sp.]